MVLVLAIIIANAFLFGSVVVADDFLDETKYVTTESLNCSHKYITEFILI